MTVPIYRLQNVQVRYADRLALDVEHLEIAPGSITTLAAGPEGLRLLSLNEVPPCRT